MRLAAYLSQDQTLLKAYAEGKDAYAIIASMIFDMPYEDCLEFYPEGTEIEVDGKKVICGNKTHMNKAGKERRSIGKVAVLAGNYGMGPAGAGSLMKKTAQEGGEILDKYFKMFNGLGTAIDNAKANLKKTGYVEGLMGRRRRLPDIYLPKYEVYLKEDNANQNFNPFLICKNREVKDAKVLKWEAEVRNAIASSQQKQRERCAKEGKPWTDNGEMSNRWYEQLSKKALADGVIIQANTGRIAQAERQCFNALIQGAAGTLTKKAMLDIFRDEKLREWDAHLIITVHDEVLVECKEEYADLVEQRLPEIMINAARELGIIEPKMKCDPYNVSRWYSGEAAVTIRSDYKKLEQGDPKKGTAPLGREEALARIYNKYSEFPQDAVYKCITEGCDLEF